MKIASVQATWVHVPIPYERQHVSDFGRAASFDSVVVTTRRSWSARTRGTSAGYGT